MKLVVCGKHSLDTMEKWARDMFAAVPNKDVVVPDLGKPEMPFTQDNLGKLLRYKPVMDKD